MHEMGKIIEHQYMHPHKRHPRETVDHIATLLHSAHGTATPHIMRRSGTGIYDNIKSKVKGAIHLLTEKPIQAVTYAAHKLTDWGIIPEKYRGIIDAVKTAGEYFGKGEFESGAGHKYLHTAQQRGHPVIVPIAVLKRKN